MEGVLASSSPLLLTERRRRRSLAACRRFGRKIGPCDGCDTGRQRLRHDLGVWLKTPPLGDPVRRSCDRGSTRTAQGPRLHQCRGFDPTVGAASRCDAEAGASPSSEASPEELPRPLVEALRTRRRAVRSAGLCNRESDNPEGARSASRLQKLVRRIFLVTPGEETCKGWLSSSR